MKSSRIALLLTCLLGIGCTHAEPGSSSLPSPDPGCEGDACETGEELCDGSNELRLHYYLTGGGTVAPGEMVLVENGYEWLTVDGNCRYYAFQSGEPYRKWNDIRTGTLSEAEAKELVADLNYDKAEGQAGAPNEQSIPNGSNRVLLTPNARLSCGTECGDASSQNVVESAQQWTQRLHEGGTPVEDKLRASVIRIPDGSPARSYSTKAFLEELAPYVEPLASNSECSETFIVPDSIVPTLLEYREDYRTLPSAEFWYGYIPLEDEEGATYMLHFRGSAPIEDEDGLIRFPGDPGKGADCP